MKMLYHKKCSHKNIIIGNANSKIKYYQTFDFRININIIYKTLKYCVTI